MSIYETLGIAWVIFTVGLAHVAILYAAFKYVQRLRDLALRGEIEERRDVREALKARQELSV